MTAPPIYLVESVGMNRRIKVHRRSENYDLVNNQFTGMRRYSCRELRMLKVVEGARVLLKYITRVRHVSGE